MTCPRCFGRVADSAEMTTHWLRHHTEQRPPDPERAAHMRRREQARRHKARRP